MKIEDEFYSMPEGFQAKESEHGKSAELYRPSSIHINNADDAARISTLLYTVNAHRVIYRAVTKGEAWFERKGFNVDPVSQCSMLYYKM